MIRFWYSIKHGIINLFLWFKVIWNDRWWDDVFIYILLRRKLELMEKRFRKYGIHVSNEKEADQMKIAIFLLDRLIKDEYEEMVFKKHDEKWGDLQLKFNEKTVDLHRKNVKTEEDYKQERKEYLRIVHKPDELREQDIKYLFKILRKHMQKWWD